MDITSIPGAPPWAATAIEAGRCSCVGAGVTFTESMPRDRVRIAPPDPRDFEIADDYKNACAEWDQCLGIVTVAGQVTREVTCSTCGRLLAIA